jgi:Raf kinase inhibitor-like YbhB/YbcL family protein
MLFSVYEEVDVPVLRSLLDQNFHKSFSLRTSIWTAFGFVFIISMAAACSTTVQPTELADDALEIPAEVSEEGAAPQLPELVLVSSVFEEGELIPELYSCEGDDISPPLNWEVNLDEVGSFALIVEDPDAPRGSWIHWVLYNLPPDARSLNAAIETQSDLPQGTQVGANDWGQTSYGGPCPPTGTHRYFFQLFALDKRLNLEAGATSEELREVMTGSILARAELMGTFPE